MTSYLRQLINRMESGAQPIAPVIRSQRSIATSEPVDPFVELVQREDRHRDVPIEHRQVLSVASQSFSANRSNQTIEASTGLRSESPVATEKIVHESAKKRSISPEVAPESEPPIKPEPVIEQVFPIEYGPEAKPARYSKVVPQQLLLEPLPELAAQMHSPATEAFMPIEMVRSQPNVDDRTVQASAPPLISEKNVSAIGKTTPSQSELIAPIPQSVAPMPPTLYVPEEPRIVIGRLSVEVIPTPPPIQQSEPIRRSQPKAQTSNRSALPRSKLRFGLGQM